VEGDVRQALMPVMERWLRIWEQVEMERFVPSTRGWVGRPPVERAALDAGLRGQGGAEPDADFRSDGPAQTPMPCCAACVDSIGAAARRH
jgi:hypothetical protein